MELFSAILIIAKTILFILLTVLSYYSIVSLNKAVSCGKRIENEITELSAKLSPVKL
jgi:hypothetical protein